MHQFVEALDPSIDAPAGALTLGMLSTFPPTECGIATFAAALSTGLLAAGHTVDVVRCGARPVIEDASVVAALDRDDERCIATAVDALNRTDVTIVQHEYGIHRGDDGAQVVDVMRRLTGPVIAVAHTVLTAPSDHQRDVLRAVCARADAVVVMTEVARRRLVDLFGVDARKVTVIAHGAATPSSATRDEPPRLGVSRLLTWGLLGPGKGIEWAIDALGRLRDLEPAPEYVVAGATHPKVLAREGERYRDMLRARVAANGTGAQVHFDATYRDLAALHELIRSADVVVLPYDSADQVTSGVLVDAVAAGRPVISTAFPHAVELLASGAGIVVPQRDPDALAEAIRSVVEHPRRAREMAREARRLAPELSWTSVASRYAELAGSLTELRAASAS